MTKKKNNNRQKHQKDVADTSEEELNETQFQGKACPHVSKAVNFGRVKRVLKTGDIFTCSGCTQALPDEEDEAEVWLCLQCGYRGCGRTSSEKHGLQHFKTIHSDCHSLVLSSLSGTVWCYDCDDGVQLEQSKNLRQCVEFILKLKTNNNKIVGEKGDKKLSTLEENASTLSSREQTNLKSNGLETNSKKNDLKNDIKNKKSTPVIYSVKGLRNLGNTCYFNAVMQNLSQTRLLHDILQEICAPEYKWEIPQLIVVDDVVMEDSPPETLKITLPKEFQLVHAFLQFLTRMVGSPQNKNEIVNPDDLFRNLQKKAPQFQNYLQQDSHELLRQFLDGIKQDEMKRHKKAILRHFNLSSVAPDNIYDDMKKLIKAYGCFANHTVVDKVFGGLLISTVLCEECKMSSQVFEPFMDMSLPLFEEKHESSDRHCPLLDGGKQDNLKPLRNRKSDVEPEETNEYILTKSKKDYSKPSKHQEKKMKQMEKKEKKKNKKLLGKKSSEGLNGELSQITDDGEEEGPPIEEENVKSGDRGVDSVTASEAEQAAIHSMQKLKISVSGSVESQNNYGVVDENAQNPAVNGETSTDKVDNLLLFEDELHLSDSEEDSNSEKGVERKNSAKESTLQVTLPLSNKGSLEDMDDASASDADEEDPKTEEENLSDKDSSPENTLETMLADFASEFKKCVTISEPSSPRLDERMHALSMQVTELRIRRDSDRQESILSSSSSSADGGESSSKAHLASAADVSAADTEKEEEGLSHNLSDSQLKEWIRKSLSTIKPRRHVVPLECSIDSCLTHFTKPELLTGNNKFRCENCSEMKQKKTGDKKAVVYSNASKQLLIFSPPAILTLHLKRFQQVGMSLRKVNRFVEFPLLLDLAPYCSSACKILPHASSVQDEILYSLYGIVEHSGHLKSGHYTAYVKICKRTLNRSFLCQLPLGQCDLEQLLRKFSKNGSCEAPANQTNSTEEGRWFYVSDGHVRESSEAQVLRCQAYLLFYERIK